MECLSSARFVECVEEIVKVSDAILDGWKMNIYEGQDNSSYISKKESSILKDGDKMMLVTIEYHVAYHISYGVPVLCFNVWKQVEDFWKSNDDLKDVNMYDTLTQMDHPVLHKPFITLHPCRTQEIITPLLEKSKNPVISWLSVTGPIVHMSSIEEYLKYC
ncbi:autophagy-related 10 isoform X2 [Leptinotarsa decemlineata]|uniref:autophagy-related 10 isoform X2 n=1 Tax=Leptinotarsa decemlineata TaxID=7539 RepID=UPI003D307F78